MTTTVLTEVKGLIFEDIHGNGKLKNSIPSPTSALIFRLLLNSQQKHSQEEMAQQVKHLLPSLATEFDPQAAQRGRRKWTRTSCLSSGLSVHAFEDEASSPSSVSHEALLEGLGTSDSDTQVELYNVL